MTETQWGGLCYLAAAILFWIWWGLKIMDEWRKDNEEDE